MNHEDEAAMPEQEQTTPISPANPPPKEGSKAKRIAKSSGEGEPKPRKRKPKLLPFQEELMKAVEEFEKAIPVADDTVKRRAIAQRDLTVLNDVVSEFLGSFILLGYNIEGERIAIWHGKTSQEHAALFEHLRTTFISAMGSVQGGGNGHEGMV